MEKATIMATAMLLLMSLSTLAGTSVGDAPTAAEKKQEAIEDALHGMRDHSPYGPFLERHFESESTERADLPRSVPLNGHDPIEDFERDTTYWGAFRAGETEGLSFTAPGYHGTGVELVDGPVPAIVTTGAVLGHDGESTGVVTKRNLDGSVIFETLIEGGEDSILGTVLEDEEGNYIVIGAVVLDWSTFDFRTLIAKLNPEGDIIWTRTPEIDGTIIAAGVDGTIDSDGNIVVTGYALTNAFAPVATVLKVDPDGNLHFSNLVGDPSVPRWGWGVTTDENGHIYISGDADPDIRRIYVTKLDANGNVLKDFILPDGEKTWANDIAIDANGQVLVAGGREYDPTVFRARNAIVWSFDTELDLKWEKRVRAGYTAQYWSVSVDGLGNIVLSGHASETDTDTSCAFLSKLTMDGPFLFHRCIADQTSGFGYDTDVSEDGSLIVTNGYAAGGLFATVSPGVSGAGTVAGAISNIANTL